MNAEVFTQLPALTFSLSSCLFPPGRIGKDVGCRQAQKQLCADVLEPSVHEHLHLHLGLKKCVL